MAIRFMEQFFRPGSIAVIGASERPNSLGATVVTNLLGAGFPGELYGVNPKGDESIFGVPRYENVAALPEVPDLAIVCTSPIRIPPIVDELGKKGVRAVLIVMGGLSTKASINVLGFRLESGRTLKKATWKVAQQYDMRIMGPNCIGTVVPGNRLNASYAHCMVSEGKVAYVGQSGVVALATMDWANGRDIGFSHLTSVGDSLDVDIADVIEYLAEDFDTRAILVHIEGVTSGRRFVSALRAAARDKLVIVMKSRCAETDPVYDAVLKRAGVLRVRRSAVLFNALESLTRMRRLFGERLAIVCNGAGAGRLAKGQLERTGGKLAELTEETSQALRDCLVPVASVDELIDLTVLATPEHYVEALGILREAEEVDAVLLIHVPTLAAPPLTTAQAIAPLAGKIVKPVLTCWMGDETAQAGREALDAADVTTYDTPEQAAEAFMHLARYRRNQAMLDQSPQPVDDADGPPFDPGRAWSVVGTARNEERTALTDEESVQVLEAAGIAVAANPEALAVEALHSLNISMGITRDAVFGPLLYFGSGRSKVDRQIGLPPVNTNLARMLVDSAAASESLASFSADLERDIDKLVSMLVRLGELVVEVPVIEALDINPLVVDQSGISAYGAAITIGEARETAILPYPAGLEETVVLPKSGREIVLRPIRAEDAPAHAVFGQRLSPESIRFRFFGPRSGFSQHQLAQFTQIDYAREMAFIASGKNDEGAEETYGVVRSWADPDNVSAEFAIIVDDSFRGEGLGSLLLQKMIDYTRRRGTLEIMGTVLPENRPMQRLAKRLGFSSRYSAEEEAMIVSLQLNEPTDDWQRERLGL
ncbi:MAG: bifunctional acetate--CoA ligase family protein/GNAT family N-acetyltransferase [Woeseiaceae bacterium]|nr:bifunctional acetate--CoA ligase family protein/GNAT family N-acetyltransferase [Woeseiaceae bacterium]